MIYDIFISYKRKSLATANNLYYRLTTRGYSVFFDLEEMRRDNFDVQLLKHIDEAKDVFVLLENGSLDACKTPTWKEDDWFCREVAYSLEKGKNIIPLLLNGYEMPSPKSLPSELQDLTKKDAPAFSFSFFDSYLDKLIEKEYITALPHNSQKVSSIFKFYSNENCQILKDGKLVCSLEGNSDEPYYLPVMRKGSYRFKCINSITLKEQILKESIDFDEEKEVEIEWTGDRKPFVPEQEFPDSQTIGGDEYDVELGRLKFKMIKVEGGTLNVGATEEQISEADNNEYPEHPITLSTFYISQFPITQNVWEVVMGYNKATFRDIEKNKSQINMYGMGIGSAIGVVLGPVGVAAGAILENKYIRSPKIDIKGSYPAENLSHDEALEFVKRLSKMTNIKFSLPSEDEWEYAARGGQKSQGYKYAGSNNIDDVAWYRGNSGECTHPVGEKQPNELGIYDMSGNVWEWTETLAHSYAADYDDISGDLFIRRGGSWWHEPTNCRVSKRYASDKSKKTSGLGLRVVIRI